MVSFIAANTSLYIYSEPKATIGSDDFFENSTALSNADLTSKKENAVTLNLLNVSAYSFADNALGLSGVIQ